MSPFPRQLRHPARDVPSGEAPPQGRGAAGQGGVHPLPQALPAPYAEDHWVSGEADEEVPTSILSRY